MKTQHSNGGWMNDEQRDSYEPAKPTPDTQPPSDTAREAAEDIEYWNGVTGYKEYRIARIQSAIDDSTAALRREVEEAQGHAQKSLDALAERDRECFALQAQLSELTRERDEAREVSKSFIDLAYELVPSTDGCHRALERIRILGARLDTALARAEAGEIKLENVHQVAKVRYVWWSWFKKGERWAKSCWDGATIEEALATRKLGHAGELDAYQNRLVRETTTFEVIADQKSHTPPVFRAAIDAATANKGEVA